MSRSDRALVVVLVAAALGLAARPCAAAGASPGGRIAVLKDGEVWIVDLGTQRLEQATRTGGKVETFRFSTTGAYLAYEKRLRYEEEPGLWEKDETPPQRAVSSIVIVATATSATVKEIQPEEWISIDRWLPEDKLLFHSTSGFDVTGFFELDARTGNRREVDFSRSPQAREVDGLADGSLMAYVDDGGLGPTYRQNLHIVDRRSGTDTVRASRRSIAGPKISPAKRAVAFVEVVQDGATYRDRLWVVQLASGASQSLYEGPAAAKSSGVGGLSWSPDERYLAMHFSGRAVIFDVASPARAVRIPASGMCWAGARQVVVAGPQDVDVYDVVSQAKRTLVAGASDPQCLGPSR